MVKTAESSDSSLTVQEVSDDNLVNVSIKDQDIKQRKSRLKSFVVVIKIFILSIVLIWIGKQLHKSWHEIVQYEWQPRYSWLILSGLFYLIGFLPSATFWFLSLRWLGQEPNYWKSIKAFYYSQLGKYVPGKAMVVVIRSGMISGPKVRPSIAAVGVFYETLTMMGVGAFVAALVVLTCFHQKWQFACMALGVALCSCIPLLPPIFIKILHYLRIGRNDVQVQDSLKRLDYSCLIKGMALMTALWLAFGLSLWAAIRGLGITSGPVLGTLPLYVAVVALAMTLGFAVPVSPGGLGVREAVLAALLVPYFATIMTYDSNESCVIGPEALATVVSLVQRITSIVAEVTIVVVFLVITLCEKIVFKNKRTSGC